jgi:hypothetical protein
MHIMAIKGRRHLKTTAAGTADINSPAIGLWDRETRPGTTLARLETAYLTGIETFDKMQSRSREHVASGKLTAEGVKHALLQSALSEAVPFSQDDRRLEDSDRRRTRRWSIFRKPRCIRSRKRGRSRVTNFTSFGGGTDVLPRRKLKHRGTKNVG